MRDDRGRVVALASKKNNRAWRKLPWSSHARAWRGWLLFLTACAAFLLVQIYSNDVFMAIAATIVPRARTLSHAELLTILACSLAARVVACLMLVPLLQLANVRWFSPEIARWLIKSGQCPACGYLLAGLETAADGTRVCPECSAAWRPVHEVLVDQSHAP